MPRIARILPESGAFHVITRGNNKEAIFHKDSDFQMYVKILCRLMKEHPFKLYHYCLMSNHVHLLLETTPGHSLSQIMKKLNLLYALYYKRAYEHTGHFWQDRFKSLPVEKDNYLLACGAYIELNPVKAGLVRQPHDYRYSSYRHYAFQEPSAMIFTNPLYEGMGHTTEERTKNYQEFVLSRLEGYETFEKNLTTRAVVGSDTFLTSLETQFHRRICKLAHGRPRKRDGSIF